MASPIKVLYWSLLAYWTCISDIERSENRLFKFHITFNSDLCHDISVHRLTNLATGRAANLAHYGFALGDLMPAHLSLYIHCDWITR